MAIIELRTRRPPRSSVAWPAAALPAALLLVTALLAGACGPGSGEPAESATPAGDEPEKTAVVAYSIDLSGVNELITESTPIQTGLIYFAFFLQLVDEQVGYEQGPPTFGPRLAESYEASSDHLALTFHLRRDIRWSDGVPVSAEDVRWSWQAQTDPDVAWAFADSKERITDVEVIDPHTVRFHFSEPYATQILDANHGVILPKHAWSELPFSEWRANPSWFLDHLVVNGPFTLESWQPQQRYVLRRNELYYEPGLPKLDRVVFEVVPDPATRLAQLRSGKAQFVESIEPSEAALVVDHPDLRLEGYVARHFYFISWNVRRPLLADREARRALTLAIDRQAIIDSLYYGYANVSTSPFNSTVWVHNDALEPWPYDPGRAREILARLGWTDSDGDGFLDRDGERFRFELVTNAENQLRKDIMVMVQEQLKRIGVDVETRVMEFSSLLGPLQRHEFDAVIAGLAMDTSLNTYHYFHSRAIDDGYNWGSYSNPELDRLIEEIEVQVDLAAAKPLYDRLQEILHEDLPLTFLYEAQRLCAVHDSLRDVEPNAISSFHNLRRWRLAEGS